MSNLKGRRRKGFNTERELVNILLSKGIWATRIPVSGISQPLPDVLAVKSGKMYGFEVKRTDKPIIYYLKDFDNAIKWFQAMSRENINAEAWLAVRFRGKKWRFYPLDENTTSVKVNINIGLSLSQFLLRILKDNSSG